MTFRVAFGLFVCLLASAAIAHPGGLDANGGHTDSKTGEYHYHKKPGTNAPPASAGTKATPAPETRTEPNDYVRLVANQIDPAKLRTLSTSEVSPRAQKAVALLEQARLSGISVPEVVSNAVVAAGYANAKLATMTREVLVHNFELAVGYGVFTEEGLRQMQRGLSPQIQVGSFRGDAMTVDAIVPTAAAPELGNLLANWEFLPLEVKSAKGYRIGEKQRDLVRKFHAAGVITQERLQEILQW